MITATRYQINKTPDVPIRTTTPGTHVPHDNTVRFTAPTVSALEALAIRARETASGMTTRGTEDTRFDTTNCCGAAMELSGSEYTCTICGRITEADVDVMCDKSNTFSAPIRTTIRGRQHTFFGGAIDPAKSREKTVCDMLLTRARTYPGQPFGTDLLKRVAAHYAAIQTTAIDDSGDTPRNRADIRSEILAALIQYECNATVARSKTDIAEFMRLRKGGFPRGDTIVCRAAAAGVIDLKTEDANIAAYTGRYLDALGVSDTRVIEFIEKLINRSEEELIGMNIQLLSKIVGSIWIACCAFDLGFDCIDLEQAADSIKKNTFKKFHNIVADNPDIFRDIFIEYSVPYILRM